MEKMVRKMTSKIKDTLKLLDKTGAFSRPALTKIFEKTLGIPYNMDKKAVDEIVSLYIECEAFLDHTIEIAEIYGKHFTHSEIKEILKFYDSPVGRKVVSKAPIIALGTIQAGKKLAEATEDIMIPKILEILKKYTRSGIF